MAAQVIADKLQFLRCFIHGDNTQSNTVHTAHVSSQQQAFLLYCIIEAWAMLFVH